MNSDRPAATKITCFPSTVNEIGAAAVVPQSGRRQSSVPVSAFTAKKTPPAAPNTNPPAVDNRPLNRMADGDEIYSHFRWPVAASRARTTRVDGTLATQPLP